MSSCRSITYWLCPAILLTFNSGLAQSHEVETPLAPGLTAPVLLQRVEPIYPQAALKSGYGGVVGMELTIAPDGSVADAKVVRAAGYGFDEAAMEAARHFTFKPATQNNQPVASTVSFDQQFVIRPHLTAELSAEPRPETSSEQPSPPAEKNQTTIIARGPTSAASSTTVRNLDFDLRPKTSPNDILRVVPGLLAVQHQGGGKADQLFLRGFDADHGTDVGVYLDGIPVNMPSHAHGQGFADLHWLIPEAIERIDVIKGPYDVRFGDFATAGAVNLITRDHFDSSSVQYTVGSFPTLPGRVAATGRFVGIVSPELPSWAAKLHPWLAFEGANDAGPFTHSENLKRYNLFGKVSYDVSPRLKIGMFVQAYGSGWIGSGQIPAREVTAGRLGQFDAIDPSEGGLTQRNMYSAFLHYKDGDHEFEATAYLTRYHLNLFNDFTFFAQDPIGGDEIEQDDTRTFTGTRLAYHFHRNWKNINFRTTFGSETRYDAIHVDRWDAESQNGDFRKRIGRHVDNSDLAFSGNNDDIDQTNVAGYFQEDVVFNPYFRVLAGLRNDYFSFNVNDHSEALGAGAQNTSGVRDFSVVSPKASIVLSPMPGIFDLYANYGTGFHTNQAQITLIDGVTHVNPDGTSFKVRAIPKLYGGELGARLHLFDRVDLATAFWASYLQNETVFDADHSAFSPGPPTRRVGIDLEVRAQLLSWLFADIDLAQANATAVPDHGNGGAVALAPKLYMTGGLTVKHPIGTRAGLRFRFLGARPAFDETSPEYQYFTSKTLSSGLPNPDYNPARVTAQGYFIMDAYVSHRWKAFEASISIQNLLNSLWREAQFGNHSCTKDEAFNPNNPNYSGSGTTLSDGSYANRCGAAYATDANAGGANTRSGATDVHFTPGVPFNVQATLKAYF